jgi:hypothetical protein
MRGSRRRAGPLKQPLMRRASSIIERSLQVPSQAPVYLCYGCLRAAAVIWLGPPPPPPPPPPGTWVSLLALLSLASAY